MHSSATSTIARWVNNFAIVTSRTGSSPSANRRSAWYVSEREASIFVAISANLWRIAWKRPIGLPNGLAFLGVGERGRKHALHPADGGQRHQQPLPREVGHDQVEAAVLLAEQVLAGTSTSVNDSSPVSEECQPIFSSLLVTS